MPAADTETAIASLGLSASAEQRLRTALADGTTRLVYLTFSDVLEEDGDRVRIESDGFVSEVTIMHKPTKVVFPEPPSGIANVTGTYDGGGGITIKITSGETPVNLPFMQVGQVVGIPVVVAP